MSPIAGKLLSVLRFALGFALVLYILVIRGEWRVVEQFAAFAWVLPTLAALGVFGAGIEAARLSLLCSSQRIDLSFGHAYRLVAVGFFFTTFMPGGTGGDLAKLYYLATENRGHSVEIATVLFVDRLVGLFTMLSITLFLAFPSRTLIATVPPVGALFVAVLAGLLGLSLTAVLSLSARLRRLRLHAWVMSRIPLGRYLARVDGALLAFRDHRQALLAALFVSGLGQAMLAATFMLVGTALIPESPPSTTGFLALLGMVANGLPLTPGGLGVGEMAFDALFALAGLKGGAQLMLAWRAGLIPLFIIGGLLYGFRGGGRKEPA